MRGKNLNNMLEKEQALLEWNIYKNFAVLRSSGNKNFGAEYSSQLHRLMSCLKLYQDI